MMKALKKGILSVFVFSLWCIILSVTCNAQTTANVTYNGNDEAITVELLTDKTHRTATVTVEKNGKYWVIAEFERTDKVNFTYTCSLPASCPSGEYTACVTIGGETAFDDFTHINKKMAAAALEKINDANEETFADVIEETHSELAIDLESFNTHSALMTSLYFKFKPEGDLDSDTFGKHYDKCLTLCGLTAMSSTDDVIESLSENADTIEFDYNTYSKKNSAVKTEVAQRFMEGIYTESTLEKQYEHWLGIAEINFLRDNSVATYREALFTTYESILNLDLTDYEEVSDKDEVIRTVMENSYDTVKEIKDAFDAAVEANKEPEENVSSNISVDKNYSDSSSSGGGGGGGGGFYPGKNVEVKEEAQLPAPEEEDKIKFDDVPENHWCAAEITALHELGIVEGMDENIFMPERAVTRAEFLKMIICALFGDKNAAAEIQFTDVNEDDWFYEYVCKAYSLKLVQGRDDGSFAPDSTISRQDMAVMLCRALKESGYELKEERKEFSDSENISAYAQEAVMLMGGNGILNGMENGSFQPLSDLSRAQAVKALYEALQTVKP